MAAPTNSGEWDMATEDFYSDFSSFLYPTFSPPQNFLPSSSPMVIYQGSNPSMDNPLQIQEHNDIGDPPPYLARDSALLQQPRQNWSEASDWGPRGGGITTMNNQGFEESNMGFEESKETMTCFYFPPSPTNFPLYRPLPTVFFVSCQQDISLQALPFQHLLEDKSGALHVIKESEGENIFGLLFDESYLGSMFGDFYAMARATGVVPKDLLSFVDNLIYNENNDEAEVTLRRINFLEQHDEGIVEQPVFEVVGVAQQLIQNKDSELDVIFGGAVLMMNRLERRDVQGLPTTQETMLICQTKLSIRLWLGHGGQWTGELRFKYSRLNNGSFTTVEDAVSAYELVMRWSGRKDLTGFPGHFENENRSELQIQLPPPAQEEKPDEDFGLVCYNATGNDAIEAVGPGSVGMEKCVMADEAQVNSRCLGKRKTKEKNPGGERGNKKPNGVRIEIPLDNILQSEGMSLKDAANHLEDEDFGNVEAEAFGMGRGGTGQSDMEEGQLNSRYLEILGKEKRKEMTPRGERRNKKNAISLEHILQYKEMPQKVAAKHLKVSLSTLKRACRGHGIPSWPPCGEDNQSRPNESPTVVDKEQIPQLNSNTVLPSNQVSATIGTKSVTVKARFGTVTMKFQLSWPWRMVELKQQVEKRLEHEAGNYHITYKDEDNDYILIACDEDLQGHISLSSLPGTNSIEVFLQPK